MFLIIGLGNPGAEYQNTKHNLGFLLLDDLQKNWNLPNWSFDKNFAAEICRGTVDGQTLILAKPQTFMNLSGQSVQKIAAYYKIKPEQLVVIHDDADLDWGRFKISFDASAAGHNGVASIIEKIKTKKFIRLRIGMQHKLAGRKIPAQKIVLKRMSAKELKDFSKLASPMIEAVKLLITGGLEQAMNIYNQKTPL